MKSPRILALFAALLVSSAGLMAQTTGGTTTGGSTNGTSTKGGPNEHASDNAKAVHTLLDHFRAQRAEYIAARQALIEKLKTATDAERKAILDELRDNQKSRVDDQRAMGKEIRDELKSLRDDKKGKGGG
jgi:hypothetical protein